MNLQLLQLIVTQRMQAVDKAQHLVKQAHQLDSKTQMARVLEIIEAIMVCKLPYLSREEIQKMLDYIELDIKKTQFYQDVVAENRQEWIEKGIGLGLKQGIEQEKLNSALRLCKRRYGELPVSLLTRIEHLHSAQLEALTDFLVDNPHKRELSDLENWLKSQLNS